jgi:hypothetical protein
MPKHHVLGQLEHDRLPEGWLPVALVGCLLFFLLFFLTEGPGRMVCDVPLHQHRPLGL